MVPTSGMPAYQLSNGVLLSFLWENDSESLWFIYRPIGETEYQGAYLNIQLGETYIQFRGGAEEYLAVCIQQLNDKIRQLFPDLFPAQPPSSEVPEEIAKSGPLTTEVVRGLMNLRLVNDQFVQ